MMGSLHPRRESTFFGYRLVSAGGNIFQSSGCSHFPMMSTVAGGENLLSPFIKFPLSQICVFSIQCLRFKSF